MDPPERGGLNAVAHAGVRECGSAEARKCLVCSL